MIPRTIHLWWHDRNDIEEAGHARVRWQAMHPNWTVRLWTDEECVARARRVASGNEDCVPVVDRIRHHANLVRWHLLAEHGGVWVDTDTEPLAAIDDLLIDGRPFCGSVTRPEATIFGAPAGHAMFADLIVDSRRRGPVVAAPVRSGSWALDRCRHEDLRILEPGVFFDKDSDDTPIPGPSAGRRLARHGWNTSRLRRAR